MAHAIDVNDLWFSYEVAENISSTAKTLEKSLRDGGLSVENPRKQYDVGTDIVYKLQLEEVNMKMPVGARCLLVGSNGAGKSTLMNVIGGKHMVDEAAVKVLGRPAFHDTTLSADLAILTGNWTHTVNFVGHNVPYQAMEVSRLIDGHCAGVDPARVEKLTKLLEVDRSWNLTTVSDGQRRRVQILCKLIKPTKVLLLDEITTDLDLLARQDLLLFLKEESEERGVTIIYCTHIFDGLDGWASHIAYVNKGKMTFAEPLEALTDLMAVPEAQRTRGWGSLFCVVQGWLLKQWPAFNSILNAPPVPTWRSTAAVSGAAISVNQLSWGYPGARNGALQLKEVSFDIPRGTRCILVGANGAGKTTLLRLLGGKHMVEQGKVKVLGYNAFHDTELNTLVALLSGDWTRQVACVGNGVPFQADFSLGYMAERFVEALHRDGMPMDVLRARLERLVALLDMNMEWRLHKVSDGQRRRAQLLLKLLRPSQVLLLDEVTTDLDVISRQALLQFLREECDVGGATVIYSTHIFDGLDDWPTHLLHLEKGSVKFVGALADAPKVVAAAGVVSAPTSGSLFHQVKGWFLQERLAAKHVDLGSCPSTFEVTSAAGAGVPPAPPAPVSFASKFDRFGGASRQSMYAR
jgi:CCR4-NOT complex subunit CAF16